MVFKIIRFQRLSLLLNSRLDYIMAGLRNVIATFLFSYLFTVSSMAFSADLGVRRITSLGCHNLDDTCFVVLDGPVFQESGCGIGATNQVRWDNGNTDRGKRAYASFLSAYMANRMVLIVTTGCSGQGYPNLNFYVLDSV